MIARTWHGRVPAAKADAYLTYLRQTGLADYATTRGHHGTVVQRRTEGDVTHYVLTTFWESLEAIRAFAGDQIEVARYYPDDDLYLLEREPHVTHHEVVMATFGD